MIDSEMMIFLLQIYRAVSACGASQQRTAREDVRYRCCWVLVASRQRHT